jgi:hypothetical protein
LGIVTFLLPRFIRRLLRRRLGSAADSARGARLRPDLALDASATEDRAIEPEHLASR